MVPVEGAASGSRLEDKMKIGRLEVYLDAQSFLEALENGKADKEKETDSGKNDFRDLDSAKKAVELMRKAGRWTME